MLPKRTLHGLGLVGKAASDWQESHEPVSAGSRPGVKRLPCRGPEGQRVSGPPDVTAGRPTSAAGWWRGACAPEAWRLTLSGGPLSEQRLQGSGWKATQVPASRKGPGLWVGREVLMKSGRDLHKSFEIHLTFSVPPPLPVPHQLDSTC